MISRDELYTLVWSEPMTKVAERFGVSGSYLARICGLLRVPRPERGYWAKLAVGRAPSKPPLPDPRPGDELVWSNDGELPARPTPKAVEPKRSPRRQMRPALGVHNLVRDAKSHFETGRPSDEGDYLRPYKKLLVDVTASKSGLDKALSFAGALFNALESAGHRVVLAPIGEHLRRDDDVIEEYEQGKQKNDYRYPRLWSPQRPTVAYFGTLAIGVAVIEMSEKVLMRNVNGHWIKEADYIPPKPSRRVDYSWTTTKVSPCGRLRVIAYSPYWRATWSQHWQETGKADLARQIPTIVAALEIAAVELAKKVQEADRQAEIEHQKWLAAERRRHEEEESARILQSQKDSHAQLLQIIQRWSQAMDVERFFAGVEASAARLPEDRRQSVLERLKHARAFLGTVDPMEFFLAWKTPAERYNPRLPPLGDDKVPAA